MKLLEKSKVVAIVFYVVAALFLIYTIFTMITTIQYLASVVNSGMYVTVTASDMISAFVGQVGPYIFYTFATFACGYMIQVLGLSVEDTDETPVVSDEKTTNSSAKDTTSYDDKATEDAVEEELAQSILESDPDAVVVEAEMVPEDDMDKKIKSTEEQIAEAIDIPLSTEETEKIELEDEDNK